MANLADIERDAGLALAQFRDPACSATWPAITAALRPRPEDFAAVFAPELTDLMRSHFEEVWAKAPLIAPGPAQTQLHLEVRWSQAIRGDESLPGGYQRIAKLLVPDRAWVWFEFRAPAQPRGLAYDGLVLMDEGRWSWLPKPWKVVPKTGAFSHWVD